MSTTRPRGDEVPEDLAEAAQRCNRYDIELYRYAEDLFDAAPEREELEFEVELAALRAAKTDGEIDLEVPPPDRFDGDDQLWRMVLHTTAASLHHERDLAESNALVEKLGQREQEVLEELVRIHATGKSAAGHDAETAMRVIQLLAPARAKAIAEETPEPKAAGAKRGDGSPRKRRSAGGRGRSQRAPRSDRDSGANGPRPDAVRPRKRRATDPRRG